MTTSHHEKNQQAEALTEELGVRVIWDDTNQCWAVCTPKGVKVPSLRDKNGVRAVAQLVGRVLSLEGKNVELRARVAALGDKS